MDPWAGGKPLGLVTRLPRLARGLGDGEDPPSPVFFEMKGVAGVCKAVPPGTIPMVSCFADNTVARAHPEWVQEGPAGERAVRTAPYFDWDILCPSRAEVSDVALGWVEAALDQRGAVRLDDVGFARAGYCSCPVCRAGQRAAGMSPAQWRAFVLERFLAGVRRMAGRRPVYLTLYPDPYPRHLEAERGIRIEEAARWVDAFVVPLYDLGYTTTYWLEVLASGFRDRMGTRPWWAELYAADVAPDRLAKAAMVAATYADGAILAYGTDADALHEVVRQFRGHFTPGGGHPAG